MAGILVMNEDANSQDKKHIIIIANILGYAGALPFIGLSLISLLADEELANVAKSALHLYGAIILSFLGGLHWGRIASKNQYSKSDKWVLIYSVLPSLIAWSSFLMASIWRHSVWMLIITFILAYYIDRRFISASKWSLFMRSLRLNLTIISCLCLVMTY